MAFAVRCGCGAEGAGSTGLTRRRRATGIPVRRCPFERSPTAGGRSMGGTVGGSAAAPGGTIGAGAAGPGPVGVCGATVGDTAARASKGALGEGDGGGGDGSEEPGAVVRTGSGANPLETGGTALEGAGGGRRGGTGSSGTLRRRGGALAIGAAPSEGTPEGGGGGACGAEGGPPAPAVGGAIGLFTRAAGCVAGGDGFGVRRKNRCTRVVGGPSAG